MTRSLPDGKSSPDHLATGRYLVSGNLLFTNKLLSLETNRSNEKRQSMLRTSDSETIEG